MNKFTKCIRLGFKTVTEDFTKDCTIPVLSLYTLTVETSAFKNTTYTALSELRNFQHIVLC